jgi:hypothetical protein
MRLLRGALLHGARHAAAIKLQRRREMKKLLMATAAAVLICTPASAGEWWMRTSKPGSAIYDFNSKYCTLAKNAGFNSPAEAYEYLQTKELRDRTADHPEIEDQGNDEVYVHESKDPGHWMFYRTQEACEKKLAEHVAAYKQQQTMMDKYR